MPNFKMTMTVPTAAKIGRLCTRSPALGIQLHKAKVARIRESGVEEEKRDGHLDEVFHVAENK